MDNEAIIKIKQDFPILNKKIHHKKMVYLDSAASSQLPLPVAKKIGEFYQTSYANVHRSVDTLGLEATMAYEAARKKVQQFINAKDSSEIIFTAGCTDGINLVASSYGQKIKAGDEIAISIMEHHSNLLPWQQLAKKTGAKLRYFTLNSNEELDLQNVMQVINQKTKIVALTHVSNVLGAVNPVKKVIALAHKFGAVVLIDGAQAAGHLTVDVQKLAADFYAFSGHKMLAPSGIGVLYGRKELLTAMPPYRVGGEMIKNVTQNTATWADLPQKFEAGTPNIAAAVGLGYAIDYLNKIGIRQIEMHERELATYLLDKLQKLPEITVYGPHKNHLGIVSFNLANIHPHDVATALDLQAIEIRAGHHCAQPLMTQLGIESCVRVSPYLYNTKTDMDKLVAAIIETRDFFNEFR